MDITRKSVLVEALMEVEHMQRRFSRGKSLLEAEPGYEAAWDAERQKAAILREMIREVESGEKVRDYQSGITFEPAEEPMRF